MLPPDTALLSLVSWLLSNYSQALAFQLGGTVVCLHTAATAVCEVGMRCRRGSSIAHMAGPLHVPGSCASPRALTSSNFARGTNAQFSTPCTSNADCVSGTTVSAALPVSSVICTVAPHSGRVPGSQHIRMNVQNAPIGPSPHPPALRAPCLRLPPVATGARGCSPGKKGLSRCGHDRSDDKVT